MPLQIRDRETVRAQLRAIVGVAALPPGADARLCGRCGEPVADDAPQAPYPAPPTDLAFLIALCPAHAAEEG